jgi:hypothetical protein
MPAFYSSPPAAPSRNAPSTFNERADDFFAWFEVGVEEHNETTLIRGDFFLSFTSALTPNTVELNAGVAAGVALTTGQSFTFAVLAENTGPVTFVLDGTAGQAARTPTGVDLPAGYLKPGMFFTAVRDPSGWWTVHRPVEQISNANGTALRFEDGTQICYHMFNSSGGPITASGVLFISADDTWTFPAPFVSAANLSVRGNGGFSSRWVSFGSPSATSMTVRQHQATSGAAVASLRVMAIGSWY